MALPALPPPRWRPWRGRAGGWRPRQRGVLPALFAAVAAVSAVAVAATAASIPLPPPAAAPVPAPAPAPIDDVTATTPTTTTSASRAAAAVTSSTTTATSASASTRANAAATNAEAVRRSANGTTRSPHTFHVASCNPPLAPRPLVTLRRTREAMDVVSLPGAAEDGPAGEAGAVAPIVFTLATRDLRWGAAAAVATAASAVGGGEKEKDGGGGRGHGGGEEGGEGREARGTVQLLPMPALSRPARKRESPLGERPVSTAARVVDAGGRPFVAVRYAPAVLVDAAKSAAAAVAAAAAPVPITTDSAATNTTAIAAAIAAAEEATVAADLVEAAQLELLVVIRAVCAGGVCTDLGGGNNRWGGIQPVSAGAQPVGVDVRMLRVASTASPRGGGGDAAVTDAAAVASGMPRAPVPVAVNVTLAAASTTVSSTRAHIPPQSVYFWVKVTRPLAASEAGSPVSLQLLLCGRGRAKLAGEPPPGRDPFVGVKFPPLVLPIAADARAAAAAAGRARAADVAADGETSGAAAMTAAAAAAGTSSLPKLRAYVTWTQRLRYSHLGFDAPVTVVDGGVDDAVSPPLPADISSWGLLPGARCTPLTLSSSSASAVPTDGRDASIVWGVGVGIGAVPPLVGNPRLAAVAAAIAAAAAAIVLSGATAYHARVAAAGEADEDRVRRGRVADSRSARALLLPARALEAGGGTTAAEGVGVVGRTKLMARGGHRRGGGDTVGVPRSSAAVRWPTLCSLGRMGREGRKGEGMAASTGGGDARPPGGGV
ncbi:hypothetical protein MMPV_008307 [Pyropia vietnamensis]